MSLATDIDQLVADAALVHSWAQGDSNTTVIINGVAVRSPAKLIADFSIWLSSNIQTLGAVNTANVLFTGGTMTGVNLSGSYFPTGLQSIGAIPASFQVATANISFESPHIRHYAGDGTGYFWHLSRRVSGVTTDMVSVSDAAPANSLVIDHVGNIIAGSASGVCHTFATPGAVAAGTPVFYILGGNSSLGSIPFMVYEGANNGASNAANSVVRIGQMNVTGRSISAAGTINASGADYAEYEKNNGLVKIAKGQIVGFKTDGTLTLTFSQAVRFGIKSTNPNLVGGDVWGSEAIIGTKPVAPIPPQAPVQPAAPTAPTPPSPLPSNPTQTQTDAYNAAHALYQMQLYVYNAADAQYQAALASYNAAQTQYQTDIVAYNAAEAAYQTSLSAWEAKLEAARAQVDRVAYCGKVPVNITGATPGQYLVAAAAADGSISGVLINKAALTFAQYQDAVGRVNKILPDGRAEVVVIVH